MSVSRNCKYFYLSLCCFLLFCCWQQGYAQRVSFHSFSLRNGLGGSEVNCLLQDNRGYLWAGTKNGLSRYNGVTFENYTTRDGLPAPAVNALLEDKAGNIWIGTPKGVCRFDGQHFSAPRSFATTGALGDGEVKSIFLDSNNKMWLLTAAGIIHFIDGKKSGILNMPDTGVTVTAFAGSQNELTIAATNGFIYTYVIAQKKWSTHIAELISNEDVVVSSIYRGADNRTWFTTNVGLFVKKGDSAIKYRMRSGQDLSSASLSITEDALHNYWLGMAYGGTVRFNDTNVQAYNETNGFANTPVKALLTDKEGNIWLGSAGNGLYRFSGSIFSVFDKSTGLPGNQVTAIATSRSGLMYIGSSDAGLFQYQGGAASELAFPAGLKPVVSTIAIKSGYQVWIGTKGNGIWRYDYRGFKSYYAPTPALLSNNINHIVTDSRGRVWIASDQGLAYNERDTFRRTGVRNIAVYAVYELAPDSILFGTARGIRIARDSSYYPYLTNGLADTLSIRCFAKKGDELWMGTAGSGIIVYNTTNQKSRTITKADGLLTDYIVSITADKEGEIWAGTEAGLHKITSTENGDLTIVPYGDNHGAITSGCNPNAVFTMHDGSLWFGTANGLLHYTPGAKLVQAMPVSVILQKVLLYGQEIKDTTYFSVFDKWQNIPYNLHLPAGKNNISFQFLGISLNGAGNLKYRYQLVGIDEPWSTWNTENTVTYPLLPAGEYTLVVQCTADGKEIKELRYPFEIATPYQQTIWFRALLIAAFVLAGVFIHFLYSRSKAMQHNAAVERHRKAAIAIRERTAEDYRKLTDDKIEKIYSVTNLLATTTDAEKAQNTAQLIKLHTDQLAGNTNDTLWLIKQGNNKINQIIQHIADGGKASLNGTHISFEFESADERLKNLTLPVDVSLNLLMIFKEAFSNIAKHSEATAASLVVTLKNRKVLQLKLNDNGKSFDMQFIRNRNGIAMMEARAETIGARLYIDAMPDRGTIITLTFRVPNVV